MYADGAQRVFGDSVIRFYSICRFHHKNKDVCQKCGQCLPITFDFEKCRFQWPREDLILKEG